MNAKKLFKNTLALFILLGISASAFAGEYTVVNRTNQTIYWQDGAWFSGDLEAGYAKEVPTNHIANVSIYFKDSYGGHLIQYAYFPKNSGCIVLRGNVGGNLTVTIKENTPHDRCIYL